MRSYLSASLAGVMCLGSIACGDDGSAAADAALTSDADPFACTLRLGPGGDVQTFVQLALIGAQPGDVLCFESGTYGFTSDLSLSVDDVTLRGLGDAIDSVTFDFSGQLSGPNGLKITCNNVTVENLTVVDTPGDGIRFDGATGVTIRKVKVFWSAGSVNSNGAYGLYPVGCTNVLIEDSEVHGAADAGIYVGQSENIIVRRNTVSGNVAGIEIENSTNAEVHDNHSFDNTAGILVFALPDLPVKDCKRVLVHHNLVENNNVPNFADAGSVIADVPEGTGMLIMAADNVEFHTNTITGHGGGAISTASYRLLVVLGAGELNDPAFDPDPETIWIHGNIVANNGGNPQGLFAIFGVNPIEDILWDGFEASPGSAEYCLSDFTGTFRMADVPNTLANPVTDPDVYACTHDPLPAVTF